MIRKLDFLILFQHMEKLYNIILEICKHENIFIEWCYLENDYAQFQTLDMPYLKMREKTKDFNLNNFPKIVITSEIKNKYLKNYVLLHELSHYYNYKLNIEDSEKDAHLMMLKIIKNKLSYWHRICLLFYIIKYTDLKLYNILKVK